MKQKLEQLRALILEARDALDTVPVRWVLFASFASSGAVASFEGSSWWWRGPLLAVPLAVLGYAVPRYLRERRER